MAKQVVGAEYWRHEPTRAVWAVRLVDGEVIGACGPLNNADATRELLHYLPYTERDAAWVNGALASFVPEPRYGRLSNGAARPSW